MRVWFFYVLLCGVLAWGQSGSAAPGRAQAAGSAKTSGEAQAELTEAERRAVAITAWDLDVHLSPGQQAMEAHALVTLRNEGGAPFARVALQLSSTLHFETVGFRGKKLQFVLSTVASDADHTGQLQEAVIALAQPLASGAQVTLSVDYGGTIPLTAERLTAIGAPEATAQASDWDRISEDFTGVRGFGNVVWYPVSSLPVSLSDGAKLFAEIGRQKLMDQDATASLRVTDEFYSAAPTAAILNGHFAKMDNPASMPTASFPGVITVSVPETRLGFEAPSFFLARRSEVGSNGLRVLALDADRASAARYVSSAGLVQGLVQTWLGKRPGEAEVSTIFELPEPDDAPAEAGDAIAMPLASDDAVHLEPVVVRALAHGYFDSPREWLREGVAGFVGSLWIEANRGRTAAIENLNADRPALALAEPASPGESSGEDLLHVADAVYYRTKAQYVLWMLRDIAGDKALQMALQSYDPAQDTTPEYFERLLERASGKDLKWFFDYWVYHDRGLPDLSIAAVYPSRVTRGQVLVAVEIVNDGYATAEVPVTVKGATASLTERVRVPAHGRITHRITFQEEPTAVDVNDGTVPEVRDSVHERLITAP
jgi:hypothetical protein